MVENTNASGYYVVAFISRDDNHYPLAQVRHILVMAEADADGVYTDEAKAEAKARAEEILDQWKAGEATEDSFAALATEKTDDTGSAANGGLYEDIYPGQMVEPFEAWCYDEARIAGDTGIVETTYGYHVMYFVGNSDTTYRDFQIENQLRSADVEAWYTETVAAMTQTEGDTTYIRKDVVLNAQ